MIKILSPVFKVQYNFKCGTEKLRKKEFTKKNINVIKKKMRKVEYK